MKTNDRSARHPNHRPVGPSVGTLLVAASLLGLAGVPELQSDPGPLLVQAAEEPPTIVTQPANVTICEGGTATFAVVATGAEPLSYQWRYYKSIVDYTNIPGETNPSLTLNDVEAVSGRFVVVVSNDFGAVTSRFALVMIHEPIVITQQLADASVPIGQSFTLSIGATGSPIFYQWYFNGRELPGKTSASLTLSSAQTTDAGDYHVVLSNACGAVPSSTARLHVVPGATFTRITSGGELVTDTGSSASPSVGDYDGDGYLDLFVTRYQMGQSTLYHNNRNGTFSRVTNAFSPMGTGYPETRWADMDNDGRLDFFLFDYNTSSNFVAFQNPDGSFAKQDFVNGAFWGLGFFDYDEDGFLDLHFLADPLWRSHLYRNEGGRSFRGVTSAEVGGDLLTAPRIAGSPTWADYDNDGRLDLFIATWTNYSVPNNLRCQMYHNAGDGRFLSVTNQVTQDGLNGNMAIWGDYDNDGLVDLFYCAARFQNAGPWDSLLYRNLGGGRFERAPVGFTFPWGAAATWADYDNDGFLDLVIAGQFATPPFLFRNNGNGSFTRITAGPLVTLSPSESACYGTLWLDYDNDGFLDVFVPVGDDRGVADLPSYLYHNNGNSNAWLKVTLIGSASNRDAVGAKVWVTATFSGSSRRQRREVEPVSSSGISKAPSPHFGLGDATIVDTLRVEWPSGQVTELHNVAVRQHLTITEPPGLRAVGLTGGAFSMEVTAHPGMTVNVEKADELAGDAWSGIWGAPWKTIEHTNRTMTITDPEAGQYPRRFYKARVQ